MILVEIYGLIATCATILFFIKQERESRYKTWLSYVHVISLILLIIDVLCIVLYKTSLRTWWLDRVIALLFFSSGSLLFALYRRRMSWPGKIYSGMFFFYPFVTALLFLGNKMLFILIATPLIVSLVSPEVICRGDDYDVRSVITVMGPRQFVLVQKRGLIETGRGKCNGESLSGNYISLTVLPPHNDTTTVILKKEAEQAILKFSSR